MFGNLNLFICLYIITINQPFKNFIGLQFISCDIFMFHLICTYITTNKNEL
jgi:hypothetical protein